MMEHFAPFYSSSGICTDTRNIQEDCLFICIKGENFNGNTFASQALQQGAHHVILDDPAFYVENAQMTLVEDSVDYLQKLANFHRNKFDIPVIGITGSNGKTTSKELIHAVLSEKYNVLATIGNLNNHLGVPFTLLRLTEEHDIAIIEMGANRFKDIEELCDIAEPTHGMITNIGKAHLEGFINFEGVKKTKRELYQSIEKNNGTLIFNQDDPILQSILPTTTTNHSYGTSSDVSIYGKLDRLTPFVEMSWTDTTSNEHHISTQLVGQYNFYNFLAAISFGNLFDVSAKDINKALSDYTPTNNRSQVQKSETNTLIIDCYNANPTSMKSALESFSLIDHPNKYVFLGDMKELGDESAQEHQMILELMAQLGISGVTVGEEFLKLDTSTNVHQQYSTTEEVLSFIEQSPIKESLILLKGSRSIGLEKLIPLL